MKRNKQVAYVVQERPADYPNSFVVRRLDLTSREVNTAGELEAIAGDLEQARQAIPPGLEKCKRQKRDHSTVVETWI